MRIFGYGPSDEIVWGIQGQDVAHIAIHFLVVVACFPFALDPLTAGLASVVAVEAVQAYEGPGPTMGDLRDLIFRGLGAALGVLVGLPFDQIPQL